MSTRWEVFLAICAIAAACWRQAQALGSWLAGWLVVTVEIRHPNAHPVVSHLERVGRRVRRARGLYAYQASYVKSIERHAHIPYRALNDSSQTFLLGLSPVWYTPGKNADHPSDRAANARFSFIRWTFRWEPFFVAAMAAYDESTGPENQVRFAVKMHEGVPMGDNGAPRAVASTDDHLHGGALAPWFAVELLGHWRYDDLYQANEVAEEVLALRPEVDAVLASLREWKESQQWCAERGIPWRTGVLLTGITGTGKTSIVRQVGREMNMPVHVIDMGGMGNFEFRRAWTASVTDAPSIVLLEDVDAVFHGRENITAREAGQITFDCLINCLDGIERASGVIVAITTNDRGKLDPALVRPGRVDHEIEVLPLGLAERLKIARRVIDEESLAVRTATESGDEAAANFLSRCCKVALAARRGRSTGARCASESEV